MHVCGCLKTWHRFTQAYTQANADVLYAYIHTPTHANKHTQYSCQLGDIKVSDTTVCVCVRVCVCVCVCVCVNLIDILDHPHPPPVTLLYLSVLPLCVLHIASLSV